MGAVESSEDLTPPPPSQSTLFVVRNGRYEPQNLMPMMPRSGVLDFEGFRRGMNCLAARPPDMKQASLVKNPVSLRRESVSTRWSVSNVIAGDMASDLEGAKDSASSYARPQGLGQLTKAAKEDNDASFVAPPEDTPIQFSFTFDALRSGKLSIHLFVEEVEAKASEKADREEIGGASESATASVLPDLELRVHQELPPGASVVLDTCSFDAGLGQTYASPPLELARWPQSQLEYDPQRPRDIPLAVRLEADMDENRSPCVQYTYISWQACSVSESSSRKRPRWSAHIFAQKFLYEGQLFVLHEVFGVWSKLASLEAEAAGEGGSSECVICLCEPRDTAVLPCRHMCFCSYCAGIVRLQCDKCPVCRQKVQSLLQFRLDEAEKPAAEGPDSTAKAGLGPSCSPAVASPGEASSASTSSFQRRDVD
eukprot:gnl/TRDRNA2_/TRDRNA2_193434_c0_seq1.p1 gnl/TRDRNA2_/TRDRNA2_193434_c0~~gnl/TRDRNA2_/TRDRNA2_193434_c0_seq1.p1  ORF type:complete len:425 (+),score=82.24 gnl/TRDRNA2_/TRDRNA2_193434_c0_seq1:85-1359(+)